MPENANIIVPTNEVQGNITNCKVEKVRINTKKDSVFSLKEINTYQIYNVCDKSVIREYSLPEFTNLSVIMLGMLFVILFIGILNIIKR